MLEPTNILISWQIIFFGLFALGALVTAVMVILSQNPVRSALFLVLNLFCVAVLYLLLNAYFLAAVQVIVYAGAIMVLFLFVIMLLNLGTPDKTVDKLRWQQGAALFAGMALISMVGISIFSTVSNTTNNTNNAPSAWRQPATVAENLVVTIPDTGISAKAGDTKLAEVKDAQAMGTVLNIGHTLYNPALPWLFPFEVTSILLLVATVGSVVLARKYAVKGEDEDLPEINNAEVKN
jgi:NADH-quinone oxidoreductase subunit J